MDRVQAAEWPIVSSLGGTSETMQSAHGLHPADGPRRPKVVQCSSAHPPKDARIFHKHSVTLAQAGYEVVLITPHLYGEPMGEETVAGVRIRTVPRFRSRFTRMVRGVWTVYREGLAEDAGVYHLHDPELIPIGLLLKLHGKKVFYDVHEDLPLTIATKPWVPRLFRRPVELFARILEGIGARLLDAVVAATPAIARNFPPNKTVLVQNYPLPDLATAPSQAYRDREPLVIYVGIVAENRGIGELLDAMLLLPAHLEARLVIGGHFETAEFENRIRRHPAWELVEYHRWQPREKVLELLGRSRIGAVVLHPCENFLESQPLKLFEYMAAGLPVIASDFPYWAEIVTGKECGLLVNPTEPGQIANSIRRLLEDPQLSEEMGRCGREAVMTEYSWNTEARRLLDLYARTAPPHPKAKLSLATADPQ